MSGRLLRYISLILCLALFSGCLSGCSGLDGHAGTDTSTSSGQTPNGTQSGEQPVSASEGDKLFTLNYDENAGFNPYSCENGDNITVSGLMYEGLFKLSPNFEAENVLCADSETTDGINYTFKLKSDIYFQDGSILAAEDVAYSLNLAKSSANYAKRLQNLLSVTATDNYTLTVTLKTKNYLLPALLDVPIVKNSTGKDDIPVGTGPYTFVNGKLQAFRQYRDYSFLPSDTVYLASCSASELSEAFSAGLIDLIHADPCSSSYPDIPVDYEVRYYDTTILQYIGFNMQNAVLADSEIRRAISHAVDRPYIADTLMSGHAKAAPLVLSSALPYYDTAWESGTEYSMQTLSAILAGRGVADDNGDSYLEYPIDGVYTDFSINFIVNEENENKVEAAQTITDVLKNIGINITLTVLPWDDYIAAIDQGEYDMYYAEVRLSADFDLTDILSYGASLAFGITEDSDGAVYVADFLGASTETAETRMAKALCNYVYNTAPIIPVIYKEYAAITHRNIISDMELSQTSVFYNFTEWKMNQG